MDHHRLYKPKSILLERRNGTGMITIMLLRVNVQGTRGINEQQKGASSHPHKHWSSL